MSEELTKPERGPPALREARKKGLIRALPFFLASLAFLLPEPWALGVRLAGLVLSAYLYWRD